MKKLLATDAITCYILDKKGIEYLTPEHFKSWPVFNQSNMLPGFDDVEAEVMYLSFAEECQTLEYEHRIRNLIDGYDLLLVEECI